MGFTVVYVVTETVLGMVLDLSTLISIMGAIVAALFVLIFPALLLMFALRSTRAVVLGVSLCVLGVAFLVISITTHFLEAASHSSNATHVGDAHNTTCL